MVLRSSSAPSRGRLALVTLATVGLVGGCQVDERTLSGLTGGVSSAGADAGSGAGAGSGASAGSGADAGSVADAAVPDSPDDAGAGNDAGSFGGSSIGAAGSGGISGSTFEAGSGGTGGALGNAASGSSAGAAGSGGAPLGCGDIDQDMVDDCTETLVQNSRFDSDDSYWLVEPLATEIWDPRNARAGTGSGSLLISNLAPVDPAPGAFMVGGHQCVQVNANASYALAVRVLIPGGQGAGEAGVNVQIFGADNCAGSFLEAETVATTADVDAWQVVQGELTVSSAARSMWVRLVASKPFSQASLDALFDDVLVREK
jgi:hypothetical protein